MAGAPMGALLHTGHEMVESIRFLLKVTQAQSAIIGQLVIAVNELAVSQTGERVVDSAALAEAVREYNDEFKRFATWIAEDAAKIEGGDRG
jgi:hypothetical protein